MTLFLQLSAFLFLLPVLGFSAALAHLARYYCQGELIDGIVAGISTRSSIDDDAQPVTRHYGKIGYVVHGQRHVLEDAGPYDAPLVVGSSLPLRYLRANPGQAITWPGNGAWWMVVPLLACIALEAKIVGLLLR